LLIFAMRGDATGSTTSIVMEMADAPGRVDQQKIDESVLWAVTELHLNAKSLPVIAVFHISPSAAVRLGIRSTSLWRDRGDANRYELWIVGAPSNTIYSQMAVGILEPHFSLKLDDAERGRVIQAVCSRLDSTVSADALRPQRRPWK